MADFSRRSGVSKALTVLSAAAAAALLNSGSGSAQEKSIYNPARPGEPEPNRLPNGKLQRDEILKADYEQNVRDSAELSQLASSFQLELEKSDRFVLSLPLLKKLDDIEKLTKKIRGRMRR